MSLELIEEIEVGGVAFIQAVVVDRLVESLWFKSVTNQFSCYTILYTAPTRRGLCAKCCPYAVPFIPHNSPDKRQSLVLLFGFLEELSLGDFEAFVQGHTIQLVITGTGTWS